MQINTNADWHRYWRLSPRGKLLTILVMELATLAFWIVCLLAGDTDTLSEAGLRVSTLSLVCVIVQFSTKKHFLGKNVNPWGLRSFRWMLRLTVITTLIGHTGFYGQVFWAEGVWRSLLLAAGLPVLPALVLCSVLFAGSSGSLVALRCMDSDGETSAIPMKQLSSRPIWIPLITLTAFYAAGGLYECFFAKEQNLLALSVPLLLPLLIGIVLLVILCKLNEAEKRSITLMLVLQLMALVLGGGVIYTVKMGDQALCRTVGGCLFAVLIILLVLEIRALRRDPTPPFWELRARELFSKHRGKN